MGYKYFEFREPCTLFLELRGQFRGEVTVAFDEKGAHCAGKGSLQMDHDSWKLYGIDLRECAGVHALYLIFSGEGQPDLKSLAFQSLK